MKCRRRQENMTTSFLIMFFKNKNYGYHYEARLLMPFFLAQETFFSTEAYYSRLLDDKGEKLSKIDFFGIR